MRMVPPLAAATAVPKPVNTGWGATFCKGDDTTRKLGDRKTAVIRHAAAGITLKRSAVGNTAESGTRAGGTDV